MTYYGDNAPQLAASVIALATLAYIVFGLRVYTRTRNGAWGMDDWCMAAAIVSLDALQPSWNQFAHISAHLHSVNHLVYWWCIQWSRCPSAPIELSRAGQRDAGMLIPRSLLISVETKPRSFSSFLKSSTAPRSSPLR
jgi:hypothetical protein